MFLTRLPVCLLLCAISCSTVTAFAQRGTQPASAPQNAPSPADLDKKISDAKDALDQQALAAQKAFDAKIAAAADITRNVAETAKNSATTAQAAAGVALNATSNVKDNVMVQAVMLPHDSAGRIFGKQIANNYVVVEVIVDNKSEDASFLLQSIFMDYSKWALSGLIGQSPAPSEDCTSDLATVPCLDPSQVATHQGQVGSIEYRAIRGELQDASNWTARNTVVRAAILAGSIATGLGALKSKAALGYTSAYSGDLIPGLQLFWPDPIVAQLNRVSDLGYQTNKVFPKGSADVVFAFFPIDRFLSPGLKKIFLKAPALFFAPAELFYDPKYRSPEMRPESLQKQGVKKGEIADTRKFILDLLNGIPKPITPALDDKSVLKYILLSCDSPVFTDSSDMATCLAIKQVFRDISLNRIHVAVGGVMSVNTLTVPASLQDVTFDAENNPIDLWTKTCTDQPGHVTGRFLTDGIVTVSKLTTDKGAALNVQDYFDTVPFPGVANGATDSILPFTMELKNAVPSGSTLQFEVIKYAATDTKKANGVKSMDFQFQVTYDSPTKDAAGKPIVAPVIDKSACKSRTTAKADAAAGQK